MNSIILLLYVLRSYVKYVFSINVSEIWQLTHWGWVTHICVYNLTIIGSDNGLSPSRRQAIIWNNGGKLLIGPLGTNLSEILIEILTFSFKKMRLKVSSGTWRPFCLGLNELNRGIPTAIVTMYLVLYPWLVGLQCAVFLRWRHNNRHHLSAEEGITIVRPALSRQNNIGGISLVRVSHLVCELLAVEMAGEIWVLFQCKDLFPGMEIPIV